MAAFPATRSYRNSLAFEIKRSMRQAGVRSGGKKPTRKAEAVAGAL